MSNFIRFLEFSDYPDWLPLWNGNNLGVENDDLTAQTWARICDEDSKVCGLGLFEDGRLVGILHYVLHPSTGAMQDICYMQDVFVDPAHRRKGLAKAMIEHLHKVGKKEKWGRIYWLADKSDTGVQAFYQNLGVALDFSLHILPTE